MITWRLQYNDDKRDQLEANLAAITCDDDSLTIQDAPDADINALVKRFGITDGSLLPASAGVIDPRYYGDFQYMPDLRTALDNIHAAEANFMDLPAQIRSRFGNDPYSLYAWISRPENGPEAVRLGLLAERGVAGSSAAAAAPPTPPTPPPGGTDT